MTAKRLKSRDGCIDPEVHGKVPPWAGSETESLKGRGDENRRNPGPGTGRVRLLQRGQ